MAKKLENSFYSDAYTYVSFEYQGAVNKKFPADPFNPDRLRQMNYISSNSMFKTDVLSSVTIVTDDKYKRLLDWAYYLKLLNYGYAATPCENGYFVATSSTDSISAGGKEEFLQKYAKVREDFVLNWK